MWFVFAEDDEARSIRVGCSVKKDMVFFAIVYLSGAAFTAGFEAGVQYKNGSFNARHWPVYPFLTFLFGVLWPIYWAAFQIDGGRE